MADPHVDAREKFQAIHPRAGVFGMALFLVSLTILFAAAMLGYLIVAQRAQGSHPQMPPIHLPWLLWFSTVVILLSSVTVHLALHHVQRGHQKAFVRWLTVTFVLAIAFVLVQVPSLILMLVEHARGLPKYPTVDDPSFAFLGLIVALIVIHALHVLGGVIPLGVIHHHARRQDYDHQAHNPILYIAMYWHFLDVIWLIMFTLLWLTV